MASTSELEFINLLTCTGLTNAQKANIKQYSTMLQMFFNSSALTTQPQTLNGSQAVIHRRKAPDSE